MATKIIVDCRKANHSGIGRYIREVVPGVIHLFPNVIWTLLINDVMDLPKVLLVDNLSYIQIKSRPFSLLEQIELYFILLKFDYFWITSLSHCLFSKTPLLSTVHDIADLKLPLKYTSLKAKAGCYFFLKSICSRSSLHHMNWLRSSLPWLHTLSNNHSDTGYGR